MFLAFYLLDKIVINDIIRSVTKPRPNRVATKEPTMRNMIVIFDYSEEYHPDEQPYELDRLEVPAKNEVCGNCRGEGRIVNPNIDGHGLTREDFDEDPQFEEDYFSGVYDIHCPECKGKRVIKTPDLSQMTDQQKKVYWAYQNDREDEMREMEWERRISEYGGQW